MEIWNFLGGICSPSAGSRDHLCKWLDQFTAKVIADALLDLLSGQKPSRFNNRSLAMNPLWLNAVEPWALDWQPARDNAHPSLARASLLLDHLIVLTQPRFHLLAHMLGSVIPDQNQDVLA